jgi:plasmid stabilization system protein ParE
VTRFTVSVLAEAEADIREAFLWYRERSLLAADGFRSEVFEAIDDLAETGGVWPRDEDGVHRRVLKRFPYTEGCTNPDGPSVAVNLRRLADRKSRELLGQAQLIGWQLRVRDRAVRSWCRP